MNRFTGLLSALLLTVLVGAPSAAQSLALADEHKFPESPPAIPVHAPSAFTLPNAIVDRQTGTITGRVVEEGSTRPLEGAQVFVPDTNLGTLTDASGGFILSNVPAGDATVRVQMIGYAPADQTVSVTAGETVTVNFSLREEALRLDELVVTGYQVQPRREVTGAISTVQGEDFRVRAIPTPDMALQGQSAGVQLVGASGQPGAASTIRIRGHGSINAGNAPLYIVDGTPLEDSYRSTSGSTNMLQSLNPSDIESIVVLRDAEATAIYGAQGANGVILITTRRGVEGATQFSLRTQFGASDQVGRYDLMSGPEWVEFTAEAYANRYEDLGNDPEAGRAHAYALLGHPDEVGTYDWQDAFLRRGLMQRVDLSASGGGENTQFYLSAGYLDQDGTVLRSTFNRLNFRANLDHQATDRLSFQTSMTLSRNTQEGVVEGSSNYTNSPFHGGVTIRTTTPIYNEDGSYNQDGLTGVNYNIVQVLEEEDQIGRTSQMIGTLAAMYDLTSNLDIRSQLGVDYRTVRDHRFRNPSIPRYGEYGGAVWERTREVTNWNTNLVMNYNQSFDEVHNVRGLAGAEYRQMYREQHSAEGRELASPLFNTIDMTALPFNVAGAQSEYRTAGLFSRLQYNYDQRYFASVNLRTDGHSRFGADRRWGLFYSGALAWDVAQEEFMDGFDFISELRPRIAYGITGNSAIGNFDALALFGGGGSYDGRRGLRPTRLGNAQLTWEEARTLDLAMDWGLFGHRVYGNIGVYRTNNDNLLMSRWLPYDSGFSSIMENVGTVRNEGLELEVGAVLVNAGAFTWRSTFNATFQRSEVLALADDQDWIEGGTGARVIVGEPRYQWWVRDYAGVNAADGRPMFYDADGELAYTVGSSDFITAGSFEPDSYGGLQNDFIFGPVSMGVFFQFELGSQILDNQYSNFHLAPHRDRTLSPDMWRRWTQPGDITDIPRAYSNASFPGGITHNASHSTRRLYDGSYVRLKNITLGYTLPSQWAQSLQVQGMSFFAQAENLITWTSYPGPDPEVFRSGQTYYPQSRTITAGVEIDF